MSRVAEGDVVVVRDGRYGGHAGVVEKVWPRRRWVATIWFGEDGPPSHARMMIVPIMVTLPPEDLLVVGDVRPSRGTEP